MKKRPIRGWKPENGWWVKAVRGSGDSFERYIAARPTYAEAKALAVAIAPHWDGAWLGEN